MSAPEPRCGLTPGAFYDTVTGEERGLVKRAFDVPLARLAKDDPETFTEALVFVDLRRQREPDPKRLAGAMTVGELQAYFADGDDGQEGEGAGEA